MATKKVFCHFNTINVILIHKCCAYTTNQNFLKIIGVSYVATYITFSGLPSKNHTFHRYCWTSAVYIRILYSLIQMKCQGGNKYALSITVKFDQSTGRFGRINFARLFKLTKHIALLFHLLSPHLLSCMRGLRNVRKNMHIIKTIIKFCAHWSTVCNMTNSDAGGIRIQ